MRFAADPATTVPAICDCTSAWDPRPRSLTSTFDGRTAIGNGLFRQESTGLLSSLKAAASPSQLHSGLGSVLLIRIFIRRIHGGLSEWLGRDDDELSIGFQKADQVIHFAGG